MSRFLSFINKTTGASNVLHNIVALDSLETTRKQRLGAYCSYSIG